jgi:hypothetical protein
VFDAKENDGFLKNENEAKQSLDMNIFQSNLKPEGKSPMTEKFGPNWIWWSQFCFATILSELVI